MTGYHRATLTIRTTKGGPPLLTPRREFLFLTSIYDTRWSSIRFYAEMMREIRFIVEAEGYRTTDVTNLDATTAAPDSMVLLDNAAIISLAREGKLETVLDHSYVLIIGESIDQDHCSFVGWQGADYLRTLQFRPGNVLWQVVKNAHRVTWQNRGVRELLSRVSTTDKTVFFPIDGYRPSHIIQPGNIQPDIDVLIYGAMAYPRRAEFVRDLMMRGPDMRIVVASNVFQLDAMIARSQIIIHVNSVEPCSNLPYGKIMKPLANNKIVFVENVEELAGSDLLPSSKPLSSPISTRSSPVYARSWLNSTRSRPA